MDTIVFFHMNQLGDCLFSLPLLAAARNTWRGARLVSVTRSELAPIIQASGLVHDVIVRPRQGAVAAWKLSRRLREMRASRAVLFSESPEVLMIAAAAGIPERIGFGTASLGFLLTQRVERTGVPSLANNRNLARAAGIADMPEDYVNLVRVPNEELVPVSLWLSSRQMLDKKVVVITPGASRRRTEKCWPAERWGELIDRISGAGLIPLLAGAPREAKALEELAARSACKPKVFTAPLGIISLAALFKRVKLCVGIDSGALHLAASVGLPVVGLYGPTDPEQIGPRPADRHGVIKKNAMTEISVDEVWETLKARIA